MRTANAFARKYSELRENENACVFCRGGYYPPAKNNVLLCLMVILFINSVCNLVNSSIDSFGGLYYNYNVRL